jgi:hypothetical protein
MDEGWDMPDEQIMVVSSRFPSYANASQDTNFKQISDAVKKRGWRGLGLWMRSDARTDDFWIQRLNWMNTSGVGYWKVDYGANEHDGVWRRHLSDMGREYAPNLTIESALVPESITWADTYRTYDVDVLLSIPETLSRIAGELKYKSVPPAKGLINCEDEVYIGAALGCSYGIMRHGFAGNLPNGRQDFVFPPITRDVKRCNDEIVRAVRWHRIAPAFAVGTNDATISDEEFKDNWYFEKDESWHISAGSMVSEAAPSIIARGLPLPTVSLISGAIAPYVVASRNPNGAVAVATLGRTLCPSENDREWITGDDADINLQVGKYSGPIGIFGRYHSLTLNFDKPIAGQRIFAQDLAGDIPQDITSRIKIDGSQIIIPGEIINAVGLSAATPGDKSDPGLVMVLRRR